MVIPQEFKNLCREFHQDSALVHKSPEQMILFALQAIGSSQCEVVRRFLEELLSGRHEDEEIQEIWWNTPAEVHFRDARETVKFLKLMRTLIIQRAQNLK